MFDCIFDQITAALDEHKKTLSKLWTNLTNLKLWTVYFLENKNGVKLSLFCNNNFYSSNVPNHSISFKHCQQVSVVHLCEQFTCWFDPNVCVFSLKSSWSLTFPFLQCTSSFVVKHSGEVFSPRCSFAARGSHI